MGKCMGSLGASRPGNVGHCLCHILLIRTVTETSDSNLAHWQRSWKDIDHCLMYMHFYL